MEQSDKGGFAKLRHDLRTCVNQILGYSELLKEEAEDVQPDFIPDLDRIHGAGRRLLGLLDGIFADQQGASAPEASRAAAGTGAPGAPSKESGSLLVVDDNEMNRDMLSRRLERLGFKVATAEGGKEALRLIEAENFDLVFLDIMMPDMSGIEVLEIIRRTHSPGSLPVIMATAKGESEDVVKAFELGANDYVTKPLDFPVVMARTRTQLSLKRAVDENQRLLREIELRNRFIRQTFGRYLSDDIVSSLLEDRTGLELGGAKRRVSILMTDLRGFSSVSEHLAPEKVVRLINHYLEVMTDVILAEGGTIDEFIGDAILVLFGAPVPREDHARAAVRCAVRMQLAMEEVNRRNREEGLPEIEMGVGINTGDVVVGNIGSERRAKYGVVGHAVNLASRIESYTVGRQILVSGDTLKEAGEGIVVNGTMTVHPKGVPEPVTLCDVVGLSEEGLELPPRAEALTDLAEPLGIEFAEMDGKDVGGPMHAASLVRLSEHEAEVQSAIPMELMSNVRLRIFQGDVYAKVIALADGPGRFAIRFTSIPPAVRSELKRISER